MAIKVKNLEKMPTMADVARLAEVGTMTVSRVLSGGSASVETTDRVQRAIKILRYQPNEVARSLRAVNSNTIGLIVPYLYDQFFATCAHAISSVANRNGYTVILTTSDENPEMEQKQTDLMLRRQVDGIITIPVAGNESSYAREVFERIPVITLDRPAPNPNFDSVLVPNRPGAKMVVAHLIGHDHQRIGFLGLNKSLYTMKARYAGYRDAMTEAGYKPEPYVDCVSPEKTLKLVRSMLERKNAPTALFPANNLSMRYTLHALSVLGIDIPR
jgi:LacI family transcriptional regulator